MKKTLAIIIAIMLSFSTCVLAAEKELTFDLTAGGKNEVTVPTGTTVEVTFTVTASDNDREYDLNSIQNEIKFDESFFKFVDKSLKLTSSEAKGGLKEKFAGLRVYMNDMDATYKKEQKVGTFKLKVIARSGSGKVESTEMLAYDENGGALSIRCKDLTVKVGSGGGGDGGEGGGGGGSTTPSVGGGGGAGSTSLNPSYTTDIFGNTHVTHTAYINGYPDGSVRPDGNITREEIVTVLYRIKGYEETTPTGSVFPDVAADRWSAGAIETIAADKIVEGYPDGTFQPSGFLTRAEFAAVIYRFANLGEEGSENALSDLMNTHWAYDEIKALCNAGLIQGYEDGTFRPENNITRAEVMTVINKLLGRKPLESYEKALNFNPYNDLYEDKWYYVTVLEATITHNYLLDVAGYEYKWENWQ